METPYFYIGLSLITAYLVGSINPAYLQGKIFRKIDIREHGSKNAGTMNAFSVLGKKAGIITFVYDFCKGVLGILIGGFYTPYGLRIFTQLGTLEFHPFVFFSGIAAVLGHVFPFYLKFKGGKGAAASYGILAFCFTILMVKGYFPWEIFLWFIGYAAMLLIVTKAANLVCIVFGGVLIYLTNHFIYGSFPVFAGFCTLFLLYLIIAAGLRIRSKSWGKELKFAPQAWRVKLVRKILRLWAVLFPLVYIFSARFPTLVFIAIVGIISLVMELLRFRNPKFAENRIVNILLKPQERNRLSGITLFTLSSFLVVFFFSRPVALLALFCAIFGDLFAELAGKKFGRVNLVAGKTLEGSVTCLGTCLSAGLIMQTVFPLPLTGVVAAGVVGALVELVPLKIAKLTVDDNFSMGLLIALAVTLF